MTNVDASTDLKQLLKGAQLPALPQSAIRLLELSQDPENGPAEFAIPIESDPGLTGQVLKFVNSSYFGFSREISSVKLAITLVGIRTIKNFALWSAVFSLIPNPKCGPFDLKSLWQDSLRRGLFARAMSKVLNIKESEDLFAAQQYLGLLDARKNGQQRLSDLELDMFGWSHGQAAGVMARTWRLPEQLTELIESHTKFGELIDQNGDSSHLAVALSSYLPSTSDPVWTDREQFQAGYGRLRGAGSPDPKELLAETDAQFEEFAPVLKLAVPAKSLVDSFEEETEFVS